MSAQTSSSPSSSTPASQGARPNVLIIGAGLGGLTMALLFEKSNVPYTILERAPTLRSLGNHNLTSAVEDPRLSFCRCYYCCSRFYCCFVFGMEWSHNINSELLTISPSLGSAHVLAENIAPLFQQLGIYEEFKSHGHLCRTAQMHDEHCHLDFVMDFEPRATM